MSEYALKYSAYMHRLTAGVDVLYLLGIKLWDLRKCFLIAGLENHPLASFLLIPMEARVYLKENC
jgi:ureidoglycolate hydrolase